MKIISIVLMLIFLCSCQKKGLIYHKYVYDYPQNSVPYLAVTEIDIWVSRMKYRNLVSVNKDGFLVNDLAKEIIILDSQTYQVSLKEKSFFRSSRAVTAKMVKDCLEHTKLKLKHELIAQISNIKVLSEYSLIIKLIRPEPQFIKQLSSNIFSIYNVDNIQDVSGIYYSGKENELLLREGMSGYPSKVLIVKVDSLKEKVTALSSDYPFDSFLAYTNSFKGSKYKLNYRVQDIWGLVLNLKGKFEKYETRECLNQSIDRNSLVENAFHNHQASWSLNGKIKPLNVCTKKFNFKILIPEEIGDTGTKFCRFMKTQHDVSCKFVAFSKLLNALKSNSFDTALIGLTTDFPYIESNLDYINHESKFSIVNKKIEIPSKLKTLLNIEFFDYFEKFIYENAYFISLSFPLRTVYASDKEKYIPSLIGPAFDSVENLSR
jgi:hypothetical protein